MRPRQLLALVLALPLSVLYAGGRSEPNELVIDIERFESLLENSNITILDIRDNASYLKGHIPGAMLLPLQEVETRGNEFIDIGNPIVTYCSCPAEESSLSAALKLQELGAASVYVLQGGYNGWIRDRKDVVTGSSPL
jgi:rhodanese-related sulfurtransferase